MNDEIETIIFESIKLELNVSTLYTVFEKAFPDDSAFWAKLALEEQNHAALIKDGRHTLLSEPEFALDLLAPKVKMLEEVNGKLSALLEEYSKTPPSRETAFNVALNLEESAGEVHFQRAMERPDASMILKMFQILNTDDKNHADRIRAYMTEEGI
jgi:hypothetical protein